MDGWNRIDAFNILAQSVHDHAAGRDARRPRQFTQLDETFTDDFVLGDAERRYNFGKRRASPRSRPTPTATSWSCATPPP